MALAPALAPGETKAAHQKLICYCTCYWPRGRDRDPHGAVGAVFKLFHQPPVIGEVIGGIMLGPSLAGKVGSGCLRLPSSRFRRRRFWGHRAIWRHSLHVPGRARAGSESLAAERARDARDLSRELHHSFLLGSTLALFIYTSMSTSEREIYQLRLFMGVLDVGHGVSGCSREFSATVRCRKPRWARLRSPARPLTT